METGSQKLKQENEFYQNMDKAGTKNSCSCTSLSLVFIFLFLISSVFIYFIVKDLNQTKDVKISKFNIFAKKRIEKQIIITDQNLQEKLDSPLGLTIPLSAKKVVITPSGIKLSGKINSLSKEELVFLITLSINDKKLVVDQVKLIQGPPFTAKVLEVPIKAISTSFITLLNSMIGVPISTFDLKYAKMTITAI